MSSTSLLLKNWIPYKLKTEGEAAYCQWLYLGDKLFAEPFFDQTISKCKSLRENSQLYHSVSAVSALTDWAPYLTTLNPSAIIFHVSRCGSTLLSQLLAQNADNIALSEVPFFDDLLRWGFRNNTVQKILPTVKAAIAFYGIKRNNEQRLFIKADSWHIHFYKAYRELFPGIPIILLYRRPDEVIRSHQKQPGMHAVQGVIEPSLFGFDDAVFHLSLDEYRAKVLEGYYNSFTAILQQDKKAFAFDYKEGMVNIIHQVMDICGIPVTETQSKLIKERSTQHSKFPGQVFSEEVISGNPPVYLQPAFEAYYCLEKIRLTHQPTS